MHFYTIASSLGLLASAIMVSGSPVNVTVPASVTTTKCALLSQGVSANDTSVVWYDCADESAAQLSRRTICARDPVNCEPPCKVKQSSTTVLNGKGTWWTRWCHAGGLHTKNKGSAAFVSIGHSTTVEWSGTASLSGDLTKFFNAQVGFDITHTKSVSQQAGCVNTDGKAHAVWFQEQMGWADSTVTLVVTQQGAGCDFPGTNTYVYNMHADFPDPHNTGFRDLLAGCGSPDDSQTPWCNFDAPSLNLN